MSEESAESDDLDARDPGEFAERPKEQTRTFGRRAMILGAAAGVGATAAVVAGARPAFAANGHEASVQAAQSNPGAGAATATTTTTTTATNSPESPEPNPIPTGASLTATSQGDGGVGVQGIDGGTTSSGIGVLGTSTDGFGLIGASGADETNLPAYVAGVAGISDTNTGVFGQSTAGTAIYGVGDQTSGLEVGTVAGVWGDSEASVGVQGTSGSDIGVLGVSDAGTGVQAQSAVRLRARSDGCRRFRPQRCDQDRCGQSIGDPPRDIPFVGKSRAGQPPEQPSRGLRGGRRAESVGQLIRDCAVPGSPSGKDRQGRLVHRELALPVHRMRLHIHHEVGSGDGLFVSDQRDREPITMTPAEIIYQRRIAV